MKIKYSRQRLKSHYKLGFYFILTGTIMTIVFTLYDGLNEVQLDSAGVGLIGGGIFSFAVYYFENKKQYLTIKNGFLIKNSLFPKKVCLKEIQQIKKFAGDYTLKTNKTDLTINTQIIDENSLLDLNRELENLNLKW